MTEPSARAVRFRSKGAALLGRTLLFSGLWWVLVEDYPGSWWFGLPMALLAALTSIAFRRPQEKHWSLPGFLQFLPFFLWQSLRGGIDVAGRAFHPRLPLAPGFLELMLHLPPGPARVFLADTLSLLPGTCSVDLDQRGNLRIHALDTASFKEADVRQVEARVAALFGIRYQETSEEVGNE
jgi:multicomponent Na+:H+ antiporter subunit E